MFEEEGRKPWCLHYIVYNVFVLLKHRRANLNSNLMFLSGLWKSDLTVL